MPVPTGGYRCANCNAWVPNGTVHTCTWIFPSTPAKPATVDWTPGLIASIDRLCKLIERLTALLEEETDGEV
jgi:hypothetical protein